MARFLLILFSLLMSERSFAARAVMEQIPATGKTIMVSTSNTRVGIATGTPQAVLDVNGNAQFGSGATRSTFSATGDLTLANNADITVAGPSGYINTSSSVNASAFFGDGAGLTGLSSVAHKSSTTVPFTGATTDTSLSVCYATQTITTAGSPIAIWYSGALHNSNAGAGCITGFLQDGAFVSPFTKAIGNGVGISHSANAPASAAYFVVIPAPVAGSHSYCITLAALSNTCNFSAFSYAYNEFGVMELQ